MTGVYGLQRNQFGLAVFLLKQQYTDDPFWAHVFPEPELRKVCRAPYVLAHDHRTPRTGPPDIPLPR